MTKATLDHWVAEAHSRQARSRIKRRQARPRQTFVTTEAGLSELRSRVGERLFAMVEVRRLT